MREESLLEELWKEDLKRLVERGKLLDVKYAKSENFEVAVARINERFEVEETYLHSLYDYLKIYFRCGKDTKIWKHQLDRVETKGNHDEERILKKYDKAKLEILKGDMILAGWADETGSYGPNYLINLEKLHKEMIFSSTALELGMSESYHIRNKLF